MVTLEECRKKIRQIISEYAAIPHAHGEIARQTIFDSESDRYLFRNYSESLWCSYSLTKSQNREHYVVKSFSSPTPLHPHPQWEALFLINKNYFITYKT